ncbi:MAG TPA: hypothetical protein PKM88_06535 [bacterium]|nr:hypothetical protein [bacterium]
MAGYAEWLQEPAAQPAFQAALGVLRGTKGKRVLVYSHDDPDGITSAAIAGRLLAALGADEARILLPPTFELEESRVAADIREFPADVMLICDKGTIGYYGNFKKYVPQVLVIDHHWKIGGEAEGITVYSPGAWCCAAFLLHNLATALDVRDDGMDFLALIGMKGDWAVEPVTGQPASPYVKAFYDEVAPRWQRWLTPFSGGRPTWFDVSQREKTCLLSQAADLVSAMCGNGFQYFYNDREPALAEVDQPQLTLDVLLNAAQNPEALMAADSLPAVISQFEQREIVEKLWRYYQADWDKVSGFLDTSLPLIRFGSTQLFFFMGNNVALLPMLGSVKLGELAARCGCPSAIIMANLLADGSTHFCLRGAGDSGKEIHLGKIAQGVVQRLLAKHGQEHKELITGGGHPVAAEIKARVPAIPFHENLLDLLTYLNELAALAMKTNPTAEEKERRKTMGWEKE